MKIRPASRVNPHFGERFTISWEFPSDFIMVVDTREQRPLFTKLPKGLIIVRDTLPAGDYSCRGFENSAAIERKSIPDLIGCLGTDRDRFKAEMEKLSNYQFKAVVVEGEVGDVVKWQDTSRLHPHSIWESIVSINVRFGVQFYYGKNKEEVERWVISHLLKFWRVRREG